MNTANDCCSTGATNKRVGRAAGATLLPGLVLALAPKCPLCVAAWLSALGFGAGAAGAAAGLLRPLAWGLLVLALLALGARLLRAGGKPPLSRAAGAQAIRSPAQSRSRNRA